MGKFCRTLIRLGEVDGEQENECNDDGFCLQEEDFEIEKITVHANYNNPRYANDIALVRLKESTGSSSKLRSNFHLFARKSLNSTFYQIQSDRSAFPSAAIKRRLRQCLVEATESSPGGEPEVAPAMLKVRCCSGFACPSSTQQSVLPSTRTTLRASARE